MRVRRFVFVALALAGATGVASAATLPLPAAVEDVGTVVEDPLAVVVPQAAAPQSAPAPAQGGAEPGGAAAGGMAAGSLLLAVGVVLYHRIRPNAALDNETRRAIFNAVCGTPGLGVHEVSRAAGVSYSTATYHLERLVSAGMIVMTLDGNKLCYYQNGGAFTETERRILPLVKNDEAAELYEAILDSPGTYRAALAERLGVTATTVNWHLRRLREAGLVDEHRTGRSAFLYARTDANRDLFRALAAKVEASEPVAAARLARYARDDLAPGAA